MPFEAPVLSNEPGESQAPLDMLLSELADGLGPEQLTAYIEQRLAEITRARDTFAIENERGKLSSIHISEQLADLGNQYSKLTQALDELSDYLDAADGISPDELQHLREHIAHEEAVASFDLTLRTAALAEKRRERGRATEQNNRNTVNIYSAAAQRAMIEGLLHYRDRYHSLIPAIEASGTRWLGERFEEFMNATLGVAEVVAQYEAQGYTVRVAPAAMDAGEMTDLILIDETRLSSEERADLERLLVADTTVTKDLEKLGPRVCDAIARVQVKSRTALPHGCRPLAEKLSEEGSQVPYHKLMRVIHEARTAPGQERTEQPGYVPSDFDQRAVMRAHASPSMLMKNRSILMIEVLLQPGPALARTLSNQGTSTGQDHFAPRHIPLLQDHDDAAAFFYATEKRQKGRQSSDRMVFVETGNLRRKSNAQTTGARIGQNMSHRGRPH